MKYQFNEISKDEMRALYGGNEDAIDGGMLPEVVVVGHQPTAWEKFCKYLNEVWDAIIYPNDWDYYIDYQTGMRNPC